MKKTETIKKNYEFKYFFHKGKYFYGKYVEAYIFKNKQSINKIGFVVSKKTGKRVKRNRAKRLIKENYIHIEEKLKTGYNILLVWNKKTDLEEANFYLIKENLVKIFEKAGMLENEKNGFKTFKNL